MQEMTAQERIQRWNEYYTDAQNMDALGDISFYLNPTCVSICYEYAVAQTQALKGKYGASIDYATTVDRIFCNKLAEQACLRLLGTNECYGLYGKAPTDYDIEGKDERLYAVTTIDHRIYHICGFKYGTFPVVERIPKQPVIFVCLNSDIFSDNASHSVRIVPHITYHGEIKVTIWGFASFADVCMNQSAAYGSRLSSVEGGFYGFRTIQAMSEPPEQEYPDKPMTTWVENAVKHRTHEEWSELLDDLRHSYKPTADGESVVPPMLIFSDL